MPEENLQPVVPGQVPAEVQPTPQEPQTQEPPATGTTEPAQTADDASIIRHTVDGEEVAYDLNNPEDVQKLSELARQGYHFTRKMQATSEWEKGQKSNIDINQNLFGTNAQLFDMAVASQNGLRPALVGAQLQPPPADLAQTNPEYYNQLYAQYAMDVREQDAINRVTQAARTNFVASNNSAVFNKARVIHELNDGEFQAVQSFMESRMRTNQMGMWTDDDVQYAVSAVLGRERASKEKVNVVKQIHNSLRQSQPPANNVPQRRAPAQKSEKEAEQERMFELAKERRNRK